MEGKKGGGERVGDGRREEEEGRGRKEEEVRGEEEVRESTSRTMQVVSRSRGRRGSGDP